MGQADDLPRRQINFVDIASLVRQVIALIVQLTLMRYDLNESHSSFNFSRLSRSVPCTAVSSPLRLKRAKGS